ncbi:MAG: hypothetical protein NW226_13150 [Microscillaceae bacterium]|nr:hypothetical protein [Microscillaceae bacterium]
MQSFNQFFKIVFIYSFIYILVVLTSSVYAQSSDIHPLEKIESDDSSQNVLDFIQTFQLAELPFQTDEKYEIQDTIPANIVIKHILDASQESSPENFKELWENEEIKEITRKGLEDRYINVENNAFAVLNFGFVNKLEISQNYHTVIFKYIPTFMEGYYSYTYLANYNLEGKLIDVVRIGGLAAYVDMQNKWTATVHKNGKIEVQGQAVKKGEMFGQSEDFIENFEQNFQSDDQGNIELIKEKYSSFSGSFKAKNKGEVLRIEEFFDQVNILYQESADISSEQSLDIIEIDKDKNKIIAQFPNSPEQIIITYNADRTAFTCKNESGKTLEYIRTAN